jgi:hypothetical protein
LPFSLDASMPHSLASRLALVVVLLASTPAAALAQKSIGFDVSKLDPALTAVVTGGYWESGGRRGSIRLLVFNSGWDNVRSRLVVQWIEEEREKERILVHASRDVEAIPNEMWALAAPRFELQNKRWYVIITGASDGGRIRRTWRFELAGLGVVREQPNR